MLPSRIEWGNFAKAWDAGIKTYFVNSLVMTVIKVPVGVLIAAMAALALSLMNLPRSRLIFSIFLIGLIVPVQMTLVPLTIVLRNLDMIDSLFGLFWIYLGFGLPFGILVLRGFMKAIPRELIEAAFMDGCSWFGAFWRIVLPLSKPALASLLIFDGVATWNEFLLAQIFLRANTNRTLPLGVVNFQTEYATLWAGAAVHLIARSSSSTGIPAAFRRRTIGIRSNRSHKGNNRNPPNVSSSNKLTRHHHTTPSSRDNMPSWGQHMFKLMASSRRISARSDRTSCGTATTRSSSSNR